MGYIVIGGIILVVIWMLSNASGKAAKGEAEAKQRESVTSDRIAALMDELRRNPPPGSKIAEMSDAELKDYITTQIHEYNSYRGLVGACGFFGFVLCGSFVVLAFISYAADKVIASWLLWILIAGAGLCALGYWISKSNDRDYAKIGLNPERLRID